MELEKYSQKGSGVVEVLVDRVKDIITPSRGTWGIVLEDLVTGDKWELNSKELFYAASVIKVPIMAAVFAEEEKGALSLHDPFVLREEDLVGGSGVLQHLTPGTSLPIRDLVMLMIIQSDNSATNMLIDLLGIEAIATFMKEAGMEYSTFYNKLMMNNPNPKGYNVIAAADIAILLNKIAKQQLVSERASDEMLSIMKKQQIQDCLPHRFPSPYSNYNNGSPAWEMAHKTGWVPGTRHDVGILYVGNHKLSITVLSKEEDDLVSKTILTEIGAAAYEYLASKALGTVKTERG